MIHLRVHHLLCSVLFEGKGYSDSFVENMTKIVNELKKADSTVYLTCKPDSICSDCPNALSDGKCALDKENTNLSSANNKEIASLDQFIASSFSLKLETEYNSGELFKLIQSNITKDFFESSCSTCRWYHLGLCSYEKYEKQLSSFIN